MGFVFQIVPSRLSGLLIRVRIAKPTTVSAKAQEKAPESKEQETEDTEPKPEKADVASTSSGEEEPIAADKKAEPKRSLSKKNKRTSRFPFLEKKKKPEEKKEESNEKEEEEEEPKDEVKPTESEITPVALAEGVSWLFFWLFYN